MLDTAFLVLFWCWVVSEVALSILRRAPAKEASRGDRGSLRTLWIATSTGLVSGYGLYSAGVAPMGLDRALLIATTSCVLGVFFRWWSILTLGRHFTTNLAILDRHELVQRGPYRVLRHPSYTGLLLVLFGVSIAFGDWLASPVAFLPPLAAVIHRIGIEEQTLLERFGEDYVGYKRRTSRLIPGVY